MLKTSSFRHFSQTWKLQKNSVFLGYNWSLFLAPISSRLSKNTEENCHVYNFNFFFGLVKKKSELRHCFIVRLKLFCSKNLLDWLSKNISISLLKAPCCIREKNLVNYSSTTLSKWFSLFYGPKNVLLN